MALPSFASVFIEATRASASPPFDHVTILQGSGFVLEHNGESFLITNGHIVTNRTRTGAGSVAKVSAVPSHLRVTIPVAGHGLDDSGLALLGTQTMLIDLYDESGAARWWCHPHFERRVDVVALPLEEPGQQFPGFRGVYLPYRSVATLAELAPPQEVSIVGFPYGLQGGASTAIWIRGTVASEPAFGYQGESCYLIDARTRSGQSGSPIVTPVRTQEAEIDWQLAGVYSGRLTEPGSVASTDLGRAWTLAALNAIVDGNVVDQMMFE